MINLNSVVRPNAVATFEMEGFDGFEIDLCYLSPSDLSALRQKYTSTKFVRQQKVETLQEDDFAEAFNLAVVKGWRGFKGKYLKRLMLVDPSVPDNEEVTFSEDSALTLMKNSAEFNTWVANKISEVENFTKTPSKPKGSS